MGSDIHSYVERRNAVGAWDFVPWPAPEASGPFEARDYHVFGFLAGLRNAIGIPALAPRRGLPPDVSAAVRTESETWGVDGYAHSWVGVDELLGVDYETLFETLDEDTGQPSAELSTFRESLGEDYFADLAVLERFNAGRPTRVVFWFDS